MQKLFDEIFEEAKQRKWDLSTAEFVAHPFLYWTEIGKIAKYFSQFADTKDERLDASRGVRGVIEHEGVIIPIRVDANYKENRLVLYRTQAGQHIARSYEKSA